MLQVVLSFIVSIFRFGQLNLNDLIPPPKYLFNLKVDIPESNS